MYYDAKSNDHGFEVDPFKAIVGPRPIGWISSLSAAGVANLAPYSFFNAFAEAPHYVAFGSGNSLIGPGLKDTMTNIAETGEFVVNLAVWSLRDEMNASSANAARDVDEFELAGVTRAKCQVVKAPRVSESPVALECEHFQTIALPGDDGEVRNHMIIGRIAGIHIADEFIEKGRVNSAALQPIARLGYSEYAVVTETFRMRRPD